MIIRATGRKRDNAATRRGWAKTRSYIHQRAESLRADFSTVVQPQGYLMDQKSLPDCVGKAFQGRINGILGQDASGVDLWIGCRAYDGELEDPSQGTTAESAIEILTNTGWIPRDNRDEDSIAPNDPMLIELPSLDDILEGFDNTIALNHDVFVGSDDQKHVAILSALRELDSDGKFRNALVFGTGVFSKYFDPPTNQVLDETYLSRNGDQGGHEQGLIGWSAEKNAYIVAGSWGPWTECTVKVSGKNVKLVGCCLVSRGVVEHAWDCDKLQLR